MTLTVEIECETYSDLTTILGAARDNVIVFCIKRGIDGSDDLPDNFGMMANDDIDFNNCPGTFQILAVRE